MIKGIGLDITELARIQKAIQRNERILDRILTNQEKARYQTLTSQKRKAEFAAGRFAAKEAYAKARGTGLGRLGLQDIEVLPNAAGAPVLKAADQEAGEHIFLSITHSEAYAAAQVIITQGE
ncbi:holo-[acyl-carrier-protein] synthase [Terribacillus aidingensis]|uniref:Holo-[acyl-carrier-protein] synthase n=1 Tax=Terribacillus aidingensis TaxID=586416 RepID=A0A285P4S6_9BACI|nr:holo-ACP synthase [Terribacillus aidingensis]SNZ16720.1 holo-[acyl-carrier-protein] synthase [Terribacillus aidingensis]